MSGAASAATNIAWKDITTRNFATVTSEQVQRVGLTFGPDTKAIDVGGEPFGAVTVSNGYQTMLYDAWAGSSIDTTDKWTVTGTAPTIANGAMTMPATASTYFSIQGKDSIRATSGFTLVRNGIQLEATAAVGAGRFWGAGIKATTPSATVLVQDGIGFEIDQGTGALSGVVYANGAKVGTPIALTRPSDGGIHGYGIYWRATTAYWVIDNDVVGTASFPALNIQELPPLIVRQNAASFTGTPVFVNTAHLTADTSRPAMSIADPIIGMRQARVNADGALRTYASIPANTTTGDTGAKTATGTGATQTNPGYSGVQIHLQLGTVSGTSPTMVVKVQGSVDGTVWFDVPSATTASITATGNFGITVYPGITVAAGTATSGSMAATNQPLPRLWRLAWTIGGTNPSFTFTNAHVSYLP